MWFSSFHAAAISSLLMVLTEAKLAPTVRMNNGYEIPVVGLGTFPILGADGETVMKTAIDIGYRHIDTAHLYGNEVQVGNAVRAKIAEGVIKREDIFVTTKLWNIFHEPEWVEKSFNRSFENLNLDYIDLYLLHFPIAWQRVLKNDTLPIDDVDSYELFPKDKDGKPLLADVDFLDTWREIERIFASGRVRSIGVSNFNAEQLTRLLEHAKIKPVLNQIKCHPRKNEKELIKFTLAQNITFVAHTPLGRPTSPNDSGAISDPKVLALALKHQRQPAQIILRYTYQNGGLVIPKSSQKERLEQNNNIFDFSLSPEDMELMDSLNEPRLNTNYKKQ